MVYTPSAYRQRLACWQGNTSVNTLAHIHTRAKGDPQYQLPYSIVTGLASDDTTNLTLLEGFAPIPHPTRWRQNHAGSPRAL